jgi:hypothetical protein
MSGPDLCGILTSWTLLLLGQVDRNFLAWPDNTDSILHLLALIELIVNFTRFYGLVLNDLSTSPDQIKFRMEPRNMHLASQKSRLGSRPVGMFTPHGMHLMEASADTRSKELVVPSRTFPEIECRPALFETVLVVWTFKEVIPFTIDTADGRAIDANQIAGFR